MTHKITDAVTVRRDEKGAVNVAISVDPGALSSETVEAILAKAWDLLAESITAQKLSAENDQNASEPGGSGGWWSG